MHLARTSAAVFGVLASLGCSCQPAARPAPPAPAAKSLGALGAPVKPDAAALANQVCELLQRGPARRRAACCASGEGTHLAVACEQTLGAALSNGTLEIDAVALQACATATGAEQAGCDWVTPSQALPPLACRALVQGRVGAGGSCRSSLECAAPLHCDGSTPTESGHCAPPQRDGSACGNGSDALATYLFADDPERTHPSCAGTCSLVTRRCEAMPAATVLARAGGRQRSGQALGGEACRSDFDCRSGGCSAGHCGMKCSIELSAQHPPNTLPALAFQRLAASAPRE